MRIVRGEITVCKTWGVTVCKTVTELCELRDGVARCEVVNKQAFLLCIFCVLATL